MKQLSAVVLSLVLFLLSVPVFSQNVLITSQNPDGLYVCGSDQMSVKFANTAASGLTNVTATVTLPPGLSYVPGSIASATEQNISNLGAPVFSVGTIGVGADVTFTLNVQANCDLVGAINSGQLFSNTIKANYTGGMDQINTVNYPIETGLIVIESVTPFSLSGEIGQVLTREIRIKNTRLGPISRIDFRDIHFPGFTGSIAGSATESNTSPVLFQAELDGSYFTSVGDGDQFLDFNESVTIFEKITITNCGTPSFDNPSQIRVGWGCGGDICQYDSAEAEVTILPSTQNPELQFVTRYIHPTSYCATTPDVQEMLIINNGNLPATDVILDFRVNMPGGFSAFDANSFEYNPAGTGWLAVPPNLSVTTTLACDIQAPIHNNALVVIPTVPANDTTIVRFDSYACSPPCNQAIVPFFAFTFYQKVCPLDASLTDSIPFVVDTASQFIDAFPRFNIDSCLVEGESYELCYVMRSPRMLVDTGYAQYRMLIPRGTELDPSCGVPTVWGQQPVLNQVTPNVIGPNGGLFSEVLLAYKLPFPADSGVLKFCIRHVCVDSMTCEDMDGMWTQSGSQVTLYPDACSSGCGLRNFWEGSLTRTPDAPSGCGLMSCKDFLMFVEDLCEGGSGGGGGGGGGGISGTGGGAATIQYETYRMNYGLRDDDDDRAADGNTPPTLSLVRRDRYIPGDTLRFDLRGVVTEGNLLEAPIQVFTESLASDFGVLDGDNYAFLPFSVGLFPHVDSLKFVGASLRIKKANGQTSTCPVLWDPNNYADTRYVAFSATNVQPPQIEDQLIGLHRGFDLDFAACAPDGQPLEAGDSLFFTYDYWFNVNFLPPLSGQVPRLINFRNSLWSGEYAWREPEPVLPGPLSQYSGYLRSRTFPRHTIRPCETSFQQNPFAFEIRLARGNMFPYEVRQLAQVTDLEYLIPAEASLQSAKANVTLQENTPFVTDLGLTWVVSGELHNFDIDPVYNLPVDEGYRLQTDFVYDPSCSFFGPDTTKVTFSVDYTPNFSPTDPQMFMRRDITGLLDAQPILTPQFGNTVLNLSSSDFAIDFILKNTRPAEAPNAWLYIQPLNGDINDVTVLQMPTGTPYPGVGGLYQLGDIPLLSQTPIRLQASNGNCDALKVNLIFGWGCDITQSPFSESCGRDTVPLDLRLRNAVLELDIIGQPDVVPLCEPSDYFTFEISNANDGNASALTPSVKLPPGLTVVPGSAQVMYPAPGGNWVNISDPALLAGNVFQWNIANILPALTQGLPGFSTAPENAFRIRFRTLAECGFVANAQPIYGVEGLQPCGIFTNILRKPDDPIGLDGVNPSYGVDLSISPTSTDPIACGDELELSIQIQVQGVPSAQDSVYLALPAGVSYVAGSYQAVQNAPSGGPQVLGQNLQLSLPSSLGVGGVMKFTIRVTYDDAAACVDKFIIGQTRQKTVGFCPSSGQNCSVYIATGEALLQIPTVNPNLKINNFTPTNVTATGFDFSVVVENPGQVAANSTELEIWVDANGNGLPDAGEQLLQTLNYNQVIAAGASATLTGMLNVPLSQLCQLLGVLPAEENCACGPKYFPFDGFTVDEGTIARCEVEAVLLGVDSIPGHTYSWQPTGLLSCQTCANPTFNPGPNVVPGDAFIFVLTETAGTCTLEHRFEVRYSAVLGIESPDQTICRGDTVTIAASPGGTYQWSGPGVNPTAQTQVLSPMTSSSYAVTVTLSAGCTGTDVVSVSVLAPSEITTSQSICAGNTVNFYNQTLSTTGLYCRTFPKSNGCDSTICLDLQVIPVAGASALTVCQGDSIAVFPGVFVSAAGVFRDTFINQIGCDSIHTVTVSVAPAINLTTLPTLVVPEGASATLDGPSGFASYSWSPGTDLSCTDCEDPTATPTTNTTYIVQVSNAQGCVDTVSQRVVLAPPCFRDVKVPNAFTPDGDNLNDTFGMVPPSEGQLEVPRRLTVFNRWGQKIYESTTNPRWDGKVDGKDAPVDVYIFRLEIECNGEFRIWEEREVTLLR
jgi:gliding motility-associated-like protein